MRINRSYIISGLAVLVIALWFFMHANNGANDPVASQSTAPQEDALPTVVTQSLSAQTHPNSYRLYGRTEANREVQVKAQTPGLVISTPIKEGAVIARGTTICKQDIDARQAMLDQAKAQLASTEFDLRSTRTLVDKGYKSEIQLANLEAQVNGAKAGVKQAEIELDNVNIRAPFSAIFDRRLAEVGDYLAPGQPCGLLVDLDPLIVAADLSETQLAAISVGQAAKVSLATGQTVDGTVRFIEARANPATRTFRTEIAVPNPKLSLRGGVTATVTLAAGEARAHKVPGRVLTLDDSGTVGVRYVDYDNRVRFAATQTIDEDDSGLWVTGLPDTVSIIIQGQDFVSVGTEVKAVPASATRPRAAAN